MNSPLFTGYIFRLDITPLCVSIPILLCVRLCVDCVTGVSRPRQGTIKQSGYKQQELS